MSLYGSKGQLVHGGHLQAVVLAGKMENVHFVLNRPHSSVEVEETSRPDTEPVSQIPSTVHGSRQVNSAHGMMSVAGSKVGPRDNHFQDRAALITQQMNHVNIKQPYGLRGIHIRSQYNTTTHTQREREGRGERRRKTERDRTKR